MREEWVSTMDFFTRMFLRDYAFVETLHKNSSHHTNFEFASLSTSAWVVSVAYALAAVACLLLRDVIPHQLNPATAPKPVIFVECIVVAFGGGWFVDTKARPFRSARPKNIDDFKTPKERFKWWLTALSIVPLVAIFAGALMIFHGYI
jgi:hypothetical protein